MTAKRNGWRAAHGRAAELGRLVVSEARPFDEQRPASGEGPARPDRDSTGRFVPGNRAGTAKRFRAGPRGALAKLEAQGDDAARAAIAFGRRYAAHRRAELTSAHGEISAGVGGMVASAGELLAASRYWGARGVAEANPDFARLSAQLVAGARQAERDAWQLATLEAQSRHEASPVNPHAEITRLLAAEQAERAERRRLTAAAETETTTPKDPTP